VTLPVPSFAALAAGNQNLSLFDQQFAAVAAQGVIACTASGSNTVILTPATNYFVPAAYTDAAPVFTWKQAQSSTGTVTINVAALGAANAYKNNGQTAVGSGDLVAGAVYTAAYLAALNAGAGGFVVDVVPTTLATSGPVQAAFKNLVVAVTSNTQVQVTADAITLYDGTNYSTVTSVNVTAATGSSGANGLDTGNVVQATWYSVWVIQNTASGAAAALLSTNATAPTMPSGYAKKARIGWVTTAAVSTNLLKTLQNGRDAQYVVTGTTPNTEFPVFAANNSGTFNTTTFTATALGWAAFAPPTSGKIRFALMSGGSGPVIGLAPNGNFSGYRTAPMPPLYVVATDGLTVGELVPETANLYYAIVSGTVAGGIKVLGWTDNI
jgi:hypothetical protein